MDSTTEPQWNRGVYLAIDRDRAKQLFAARTPEALDDFLESCCSDDEYVASPSFADCEGNWPALKQQLETLAEAANEDSRPLLEFAARGLRPVVGEDESFIVRPDVVAPIADVLAAVEPTGQTEVDDLLTRVQQVYATAAAQRGAVALLYRRS